jgi:hypothetical protein
MLLNILKGWADFDIDGLWTCLKLDINFEEWALLS